MFNFQIKPHNKFNNTSNGPKNLEERFFLRASKNLSSLVKFKYLRKQGTEPKLFQFLRLSPCYVLHPLLPQLREHQNQGEESLSQEPLVTV